MKVTTIHDLLSPVPVPPGCRADARLGTHYGNDWRMFEVEWFFCEGARCSLSARQERAEEHRRLGQCEHFTDAWKSSDLCGGTPKPSGGDPVNRRVLAKIRGMTPDDVFALSVRVGVHNPDGTLTPEYGGADPSPDGGKVGP